MSRLEEIKASLPASTRLIAVSKFHPVEKIMEAYNAGQRLFGENRVQELVQKQPALPDDIEWHMIGTLQRNKVRQIVPFVHTIHSVDSVRLLNEIEKQCIRLERDSLRVLMQVHISGEETKHGFTPDELRDYFESGAYKELKHTHIVGLMGMAALTDDMSIVEQQFDDLRLLFEEFKTNFFANSDEFKELSMGMSDDYLLAVKHGSTYVRIGTSIFGEREY